MASRRRLISCKGLRPRRWRNSNSNHRGETASSCPKVLHAQPGAGPPADYLQGRGDLIGFYRRAEGRIAGKESRGGNVDRFPRPRAAVDEFQQQLRCPTADLLARIAGYW